MLPSPAAAFAGAERFRLGEDSCTGDAEQGGDAAGHLRCLWAASQPCSPLVGAPAPKPIETHGSERQEHRGQGAGNTPHCSSISIRSK